ncbi:nucleotide pyrophosphohydrolase domain protein [Vibrio phage phiV141]|uniref:Nucleotide pyrophosphohydrolase domain protein n=1 Tax=Vibrio phage phiV141 TaxID=2723905 RepID=A0A7D7EWM6_9CAUD|nr:nucleotide pyrophosphohydrolase domain protein [Vibrio phage phiV141]
MKNYIELALRTESSEAPLRIMRGTALAGLLETVVDVGELADLVKKSVFYDGDLGRLASQQVVDLTNTAEGRNAFYKGSMNPRLLHAGLGMLTEAVEFLEALHKAALKGEPVDKVNLGEELGDQFWYQAIAADELGTTFDKEQRTNIEKLQLRYPDKFTQKRANNRDLDAERKLLERD